MQVVKGQNERGFAQSGEWHLSRPTCKRQTEASVEVASLPTLQLWSFFNQQHEAGRASAWPARSADETRGMREE